MEDKTLKVLLVEDDPDDAFLLRDMLKDVGTAQFDLAHVSSLGEALATADRQSFDVALLDLSLPDSRGLETFTQLHERVPELPVVVLTGLDDETMAVNAVQSGAQDYLVKGQVGGTLLVRSIRYAIERQRVSYYKDLLAERELFDTAISQMGDGIIVADGNWRVTVANRAACVLLDLPPDEWQGMPLDKAFAPFELSTPWPQIAGSEAPFLSFDMSRTETPYELLLEARRSRLLGARGEPVSMVVMLRDVTNERLSRHIQADFMTALPHKLRTPLSVLLGYLTLARRVPAEQLPEHWPELSRIWEGELRQLIDMVQKLLDFEALTVEQLQEALRPTEVRCVVDQAVAELRQQYPGTALEIEVSLDPDAAVVDCSPEHLAFVLHELLDNAVKFADKTPVQIEVAVTRSNPEALSFAVRDNGPGIPHQYYDRVFEDFFQVEKNVTGQVPGLGVGLGMLREVVRANGGAISVRSQLGEGSTFTFSLPTPAPTA